jgi:hypothetical protein
MAVRLRYFTILTVRMIDGMLGWIEASSGVYAAGEAAFGGLDREGLIAIIVISIIAIAAFVWIFRGLRKRG